ncbi:MAG: DNA polymerase III subunit epsilon [Alphaproteobacteria bacterium]|nr:DNA polymerase III subunit epsilon [Alphaproteobacteria bacterium]
MREIVLDTETTGLDPAQDRIVEIGCVELYNHMPTGKVFQSYLNPERVMSQEARGITGLTDAFLKDKPVFADKVDEFLAFIKDSALIIHNAPFDIGFLNHELKRLNKPPLPNRVIDTLALARAKYIGQKNSLDDICQRLDIDNSNRTKHGALLDAELLAEVYLEWHGGRQPGLGLQAGKAAESTPAMSRTTSRTGPRTQQIHKTRPNALPPRLTIAQHQAHLAFLDKLPKRAKWLTQTD